MKRFSLLLVLAVAVFSFGFNGCTEPLADNVPVSNGGVSQKSVKVATDQNGLTVEQKNIGKRLSEDNKPGSIKHLYIISTYSGDVLIYSTVQGKVTSSGKRLTPTTVNAGASTYEGRGIPVTIGNTSTLTTEVIQDDGVYGSSVEYIYWWDTKGVYHQQYITGGMLVHISNQPIAIKKVILNLETQDGN